MECCLVSLRTKGYKGFVPFLCSVFSIWVQQENVICYFLLFAGSSAGDFPVAKPNFVMLYLMQQKAGNLKFPFLGKDGKRYQIHKKEKVPKPYSC